MGSAVFGGIPVTGTIARTATNVRAGAHGPVSGILHAGYLLVFMLVAAPLAGYIPLAALGAVLAVVAWNMAERQDFVVLLGASAGDRLILLATFLLTVFVDLATGIGVGVVLGAFIFLHRMAESVVVEGQGQLIADDRADDYAGRTSYDPAESASHQWGVLLRRGVGGQRRSGADRPIAADPGARLLRSPDGRTPRRRKPCRASPISWPSRGPQSSSSALRRGVRRELIQAGLRKPLVRYARSAEQAVAAAKPKVAAADVGT